MRRISSLLSCCISTAIFASAPTQQTVPLAYEDLPAKVAEGNHGIEAARFRTESAETRTGHLARSYLPSVRLEAGAETFTTGPYPTSTQPFGGVEGSINLFNGGRDLLEDRIRSNELRIARSEEQKESARALRQARDLYWQLVANSEYSEVLNEESKRASRLLETAEKRIARGLSTVTDRLEFQIYAGQLHESLETLKTDSEAQSLRLSAVLGLDQNATFATEKRVPHVHDESLLAPSQTLDDNYEVVALSALSESADDERAKAHRWWLPEMEAYAAWWQYTLREREYLTTDLRQEQVVGFRLRLNLFDGLESPRIASERSLRALAARSETDQRQREVRSELLALQEELKRRHELVHLGEERIKEGSRYLTSVLDEYTRGVKNSVDVLAATQRYLDFRKDEIERRKEYQETKSKLLALLGK